MMTSFPGLLLHKREANQSFGIHLRLGGPWCHDSSAYFSWVCQPVLEIESAVRLEVAATRSCS
jgi:hypothetical protein